MIIAPERITKNDEGDAEEKIKALYEYIDNLTERINVAGLQIGDKLEELEARIATLETAVSLINS